MQKRHVWVKGPYGPWVRMSEHAMSQQESIPFEKKIRDGKSEVKTAIVPANIDPNEWKDGNG